MELLEARAKPAIPLMRSVGAELRVGDGGERTEVQPTHIYVVWTGFSEATRARLAQALSAHPPGTKLITSSYPVEHEAFEVLSEHRAVYTWGLDQAFVAVRRAS